VNRLRLLALNWLPFTRDKMTDTHLYLANRRAHRNDAAMFALNLTLLRNLWCADLRRAEEV